MNYIFTPPKSTSIRRKPNKNNHLANISICDVASKFQFEDNFSGEEDALLNNQDSSDTSTPLMPNKSFHPPTPITPVSDDRNKSTVDLTHSSHDEQIEESGSNSNIYSDSNSTSVSSFFSDSSSHSVSCTKPQKFKKVKLNWAIMDKAPMKIVDEISWNINSNVIYKIKCTE